MLFVGGGSAFFACSPGDGAPTGNDDGAKGGDIDPATGIIGGEINGPGDDGADDPTKLLEAPPGCGNGTLEPDEVCDDGGRQPDDGCYANCLGIDTGYICPTPGELCDQFAVCGDGITAFPEQCDDSNATAGDGCSDNCKIEIGYKCPDQGQPCSPTTCGDGVVEGAEMCEPSLTEGCTAQCQFAPDCSSGACTSACGDGLVLGEECDDGNTLNGDGCSSDCKPEPGYTCTNESTSGECERSPTTGECILRIPVTYRDFAVSHSDFESSCAGDNVTLNIVNPTLTAGKPTLSGKVTTMCTTGFADWYNDGPNSTPFRSEIVLYESEEGSYVNRWGAAGEKYPAAGGWSGVAMKNCTNADPCGPYDGNPFFFPIDDMPNPKDSSRSVAEIYDGSKVYGGIDKLIKESDILGTSPMHNFAYTSEIAYWFTFDESTNASLSFAGDDDVWVFLNGVLALDLGGLHPAAQGTVEINSSTAAKYNMTPGNVYEIKVFHAERHTTGSTFKLTLAGFDTSRSDCRPECGDGVVAFGEQCDDGVNDGGYNECGEGCKLGSYCGDGVVDEGEACDDPNDAACKGCRYIVIK